MQWRGVNRHKGAQEVNIFLAYTPESSSEYDVNQHVNHTIDNFAHQQSYSKILLVKCRVSVHHFKWCLRQVIDKIDRKMSLDSVSFPQMSAQLCPWNIVWYSVILIVNFSHAAAVYPGNRALLLLLIYINYCAKCV